jgi:hypothetical protein
MLLVFRSKTRIQVSTLIILIIVANMKQVNTRSLVSICTSVIITTIALKRLKIFSSISDIYETLKKSKQVYLGS